MRWRWIRMRPTRRENALAAMIAVGAGAGVAAVAFYLVRLFVAREEIGPLPSADREDASVSSTPPVGNAPGRAGSR